MEPAQIEAAATATGEVLGDDAEAKLVMALGRAYHQSGVPSDQLEELMHNAALALGLELQVTALPTSITAAVGPGYAQKVVLLRLEPGAIDLQRLALLNIVYEGVLARTFATRVASTEIERISALGHAAPALPTLAAYCALSLGASIILGGHPAEAACATLIGLALGALSLVGRRVAAVARLFEVLASLVATTIVTAYSRVAPHLDVYVPLVAGVVVVLPGLQLTTALHELAYRNLVAGTSRLGGVVMTLLSLGCGFALGIALVGPGAMHIARIAYAPVAWYGLVIAVVAIASAIGVLQNARALDYPWVLGSCAVAELAYRLFAMLPGYQVSTFGAALAVGLVTSLGSRYARIPQAVLLVPGLLILVPGSLSYESIVFVLQRNVTDAAGIAVASTVAAVEIVAGILLAQLLIAPPHGFRGLRSRG
jgi:uncharacterized membrane protein YjjP (DUF1212 family)